MTERTESLDFYEAMAIITSIYDTTEARLKDMSDRLRAIARIVNDRLADKAHTASTDEAMTLWRISRWAGIWPDEDTAEHE